MIYALFEIGFEIVAENDKDKLTSFPLRKHKFLLGKSSVNCIHDNTNHQDFSHVILNKCSDNIRVFYKKHEAEIRQKLRDI